MTLFDLFSVRALRVSAFVCVLASVAGAHAQQLPEIGLSVNGHKLTAEVAYTDPSARRASCTGACCRRTAACCSCSATRTPRDVDDEHLRSLSVAFLDPRGVIINIEDMEPQTQDTHPALKPAKYALEMNKGWFARRGIKPGARLEGIGKAPAAQ